MATETNLAKINVFPSESSYNTNKSGLGSDELSIVKVDDDFFTDIYDIVTPQSTQDNYDFRYIRYQNGLMIQWGCTEENSGNTVTFPLPFVNIPVVVATKINGTGTSVSVNNIFTTTVNVTSNGKVYWIAIGWWK